MHKKIIASSLTFLLLLGCNETSTDESHGKAAQSNQEKIDQSKAVTAKPTLFESGAEQASDDITVAKQKIAQYQDKLNKGTSRSLEKLAQVGDEKRSISLNKQKFIIDSENVVKGSRVFNVLMGEHGRIKGSVVVVVRDSAAIEENKLQSSNKIANDTYRLWPDSAEQLLDFYRTLDNNNHFSTVEIEIDYSGEKNAQSY